MAKEVQIASTFVSVWLMYMFFFFSSQCLPIHGHGFVLDKYKCHCKKGFYHPNRVAVNGFSKSLTNLSPIKIRSSLLLCPNKEYWFLQGDCFGHF